MGYALVIAGLLMVVTGGRGTYQQFGKLIAGDFTGPNNFTYWIVGLGAVGAVGYIDALRTISRLFMALVIIGLFLSNKGFFAKFTEALKTGPVAPEAIAAQSNAYLNSVTSDPRTAGNSDVQAQKKASEPKPFTFGDILTKINPFGSTPAY